MRVSHVILGLCFAVSAVPALAAEGGHGGGGSSHGGSASHESGSSEEQAPASRQERLTSAESYVPLPTLSAGVIQRQMSNGTIVVDMGLDIPDAELRRRALLQAPRLRDTLRTALATYASTYYREHTAPDPTTLTRLMQQSIDRLLGAQGARVLMVNIIFQRGQRVGG